MAQKTKLKSSAAATNKKSSNQRTPSPKSTGEAQPHGKGIQDIKSVLDSRLEDILQVTYILCTQSNSQSDKETEPSVTAITRHIKIENMIVRNRNLSVAGAHDTASDLDYSIKEVVQGALEKLHKPSYYSVAINICSITRLLDAIATTYYVEEVPTYDVTPLNPFLLKQDVTKQTTPIDRLIDQFKFRSSSKTCSNTEGQPGAPAPTAEEKEEIRRKLRETVLESAVEN